MSYYNENDKYPILLNNWVEGQVSRFYDKYTNKPILSGILVNYDQKNYIYEGEEDDLVFIKDYLARGEDFANNYNNIFKGETNSDFLNRIGYTVSFFDKNLQYDVIVKYHLFTNNNDYEDFYYDLEEEIEDFRSLLENEGIYFANMFADSDFRTINLTAQSKVYGLIDPITPFLKILDNLGYAKHFALKGYEIKNIERC